MKAEIGSGAEVISSDGTAGPVTLELARGPAIGPVLARVVRMIAGSAEVPIDRLEDVVLMMDAIAIHAPPHLHGDRLRLTVDAQPRVLNLRAGPMMDGSAKRVLDENHLPEIGSVLERLADEVSIEADSEGLEYLKLVVRF